MRRVRGYVLLEAIGAIAVLSVGIVGVQEGMRQAVLTRAQARDYTQARFMLEELVSQLQVRPQLATGKNSGDYGENYPRFRWSYNVTRIDLPQTDVPVSTRMGPDGQPIPLKLPVKFMGCIDVTVSWTLQGVKYTRSTRTLCQPERLIGYDVDETS